MKARPPVMSALSTQASDIEDVLRREKQMGRELMGARHRAMHLQAQDLLHHGEACADLLRPTLLRHLQV